MTGKSGNPAFFRGKARRYKPDDEPPRDDPRPCEKEQAAASETSPDWLGEICELILKIPNSNETKILRRFHRPADATAAALDYVKTCEGDPRLERPKYTGVVEYGEDAGEGIEQSEGVILYVSIVRVALPGDSRYFEP